CRARRHDLPESGSPRRNVAAMRPVSATHRAHDHRDPICHRRKIPCRRHSLESPADCRARWIAARVQAASPEAEAAEAAEAPRAAGAEAAWPREAASFFLRCKPPPKTEPKKDSPVLRCSFV